jgi:peroxin-16
MWVGWTRPKIMAVVKGLERIPLIGIAGGFVEGYIPLVDDYFYCESLIGEHGQVS